MAQMASPVVDEGELRRVFGCFPSGVIAVCAIVDGEPVGMAASSFTSVSVLPALVCICVQNTSTTWPRLRTRPRLGVSVLADCHDGACLGLSRKTGNRFAGVSWTEQQGGAVLVDDASAWFECTLHSEVSAGDHTIVLLEIRRLGGNPDTPPLVFHGSRFRQLAGVCVPGERR